MATQTRVPTGDGTATNWNASAGSKWDTVNDPVGSADDDTSYLTINTSGQRNDCTFAVFTVPGGSTINSVQIKARIKYVGTSSDFRLNLRNEAAGISEGSDTAATSSYADYTRTLSTNPWTAAAWTVNEVNGDGGTSNRMTEMEIRSIAPNTEIRCTQVYLLVDYTAGGGGGGSVPLYVDNLRRQGIL